MAIDIYELALRFKSEGFKAVSRDMDTLDKKGKGIAKAFTALKATLIVGAVAGFVRKIAVESIEAQKQAAQLNAVIKSTGGIAGVTAGDIDKMAGSLQKTTVFSDEAVKSSASLLLTFTNIRGEVFRQTLPAITDLATALGTDLNTATLQVGKALQDPVRGITALRRAGVSFSEAQQNVIKNLVATNRLAEAQGIILKELSVQFGGSAEAARNTLGGALAGLSNAWGDLFEVTQDSSKGIVGFINDIADALPNARTKIDAAFGGLVKWVEGVERRMAKLQAIAFSINRFFGGSAGAQSGPAGVGTTTLGGENIGLKGGTSGSGNNKPLSRIGTGTDKGVKIPGFDMSAIGQAQIDSIGNINSVVVPGLGMSVDDLEKIYENFRAARQRIVDEERSETEKAAAKLEADILSMNERLSGILGDSVSNAFIAAFSGAGIGEAFAELGKTILSGLGQIFVEMGQKMIVASGIMEGFAKALVAFLPGGGLIAGLALVALGSGMMAAGGAGGRGGSGSGGGRSLGGGYNGSADAVRLKFADRPSRVSDLSPVQPVTINAYGPNDPKTQRWMLETFTKATRR